MRNVTVLDQLPGRIWGSATGEYLPPGSHVYMGNVSNQILNTRFEFSVPKEDRTHTISNLMTKAEVTLIFDDVGWDI